MKIRIYNNHGQVSITKQHNDEEEDYVCSALNDGEGIVIDIGASVTYISAMHRKSEKGIR